MTLAEFFDSIAKLSGLLFVVSSMLAMGLSLTMAQILQPLKNVRVMAEVGRRHEKKQGTAATPAQSGALAQAASTSK